MMTIKTPVIAAVAAALLAWGGASAIAADAPQDAATQTTTSMQGHQRMQGKHMDSERWQQRRAERAEALKQKLQLTPAQQPAWEAFQQAMQPQEHARLDRGEMQKLTTPERIDRMRALRSERAAEADRRGDAVKSFYTALTPEQQKVFDAQAGERQHRGMRSGHGHRHGGNMAPSAS